MNTPQFAQLINEANNHPFSGWDFSFIEDRFRQADLPWSYTERVQALLRTTQAMLDLGTGGGEFLASLSPLPAVTCATEGYLPNIDVAQKRLAPLNVQVYLAATDASLPFSDFRFDLVINRHTAFVADEVLRVLTPGGRFLTQQVGDQNYADLSSCFQGLDGAL